MRYEHGLSLAVLGVISRHPTGLHGYAVRPRARWLLARRPRSPPV